MTDQISRIKNEFLDGILTKVGARRFDDIHRSINLVFRYPYVNDVFNWTNKRASLDKINRLSSVSKDSHCKDDYVRG